jgi:AraC-like DNA-binding protein
MALDRARLASPGRGLPARREGAGADWARYWRSGSQPIEAMHAHFSGHVYHRHSHESYSFGLTEDGAQAFGCRNAQHVSAAGMIMMFNPDEPHDGHAATEAGFTYRMTHVGPDLLTAVMSDVAGRRAGLPLFPVPVADDRLLAARLRRLHGAVSGQAGPLEVYERLAGVVCALDRHAAGRAPRRARLDELDAAAGGWPAGTGRAALAGRVRELLHAEYAGQVTADDLAAAAGCSRFAAYRAFRSAFGLSPSDYQRQLRLRAARALLAAGTPAADAAAAAGFADQAHLTRWFRRYYGITPGEYRSAGPEPAGSASSRATVMVNRVRPGRLVSLTLP